MWHSTNALPGKGPRSGRQLLVQPLPLLLCLGERYQSVGHMEEVRTEQREAEVVPGGAIPSASVTAHPKHP